ncbi:hypothetical protein B0T14DRAFT_508821 [Immersiella caudata]|uniref:Clr5 domain-containing protein n=1 Tax=Immersiella caudata TaxID=314043 RepID=A0AA40C5Z8_9PEZI|nr:hypothetical protein B0T14DRAFT_508821 [Immersiella caudata]
MRSTNLPMTLGLRENRAATMSTASGPPPPLPGGPPSERSASPDRKSRTLQGPSPKEWARHRETIIDLYRQYPLKRVSEIMRKHHGFSASKRMYDKRFREWNVFKNVNSDEKDRSVRRTHAARARAVPTPIIDRDSISQEDLRRTIRVAKSIPQGMRQTPTAEYPHPGPLEVAESHQQSFRAGRRVLGISDLIRDQGPSQGQVLEVPQHPPSSEGLSPQTMSSSPDLGCATPASTTGSSDEQTSSTGHIGRSPPGSPLPNLSTFEAQIKRLAETPPPQVPADPKTHSLGVITRSLRSYYDWQLNNIPEGVLPDDYLGSRVSQESTEYWGTIKNAIYLVKVSQGSMEELDHRPDRRAWPAFAEAGKIASAAMTTHPFEFLRNVFATLSPANTSARPELRGILLQFLTSEARDTLSPNHPITMICQELQRDEDCQEISRRGLQCMLDIFSSRLDRSRAVSFKLLDSLATLLRRNGEFDAAMDIILELLNSCRQVFGRESDQARMIENELAHFYMVADECDLALDHCMAVVKRPQPVPGPLAPTEPMFYQDGIAAHSMEDIAEIHQRRGDVEASIVWLERAASIALALWGPKSIATGHIIDKMTSLQRRFGKDLLRSALLWEAAIVS